MLYHLVRLLSSLFQVLPQAVAMALGRLLAFLWYYLIPIRKSVAVSNLQVAFPELSAKERKRIARAAFRQMGLCLVEYLRLPLLSPQRTQAWFEHQGIEHLQQALQNGKGAIVVTAHFGNFDLMAAAAALQGIPVHIVTRQQKAAGINRWWMKVRSEKGIGLLHAKESAWKIGKLLKSNQTVALVIDQHMPPKRGIVVDFFNKPASTTHAPALLAQLTQAPIIPVTIHRLPDNRHRIVYETPISVNPHEPTEPRATTVIRTTERLNTWLEDKIRAKPDHWMWIHRRWKITPIEAQTKP